MKNHLHLTTAAVIALTLSAPAFAQKPITKPPVASILTWTQKQQLERYPNIESVYAVAPSRRATRSTSCPPARPSTRK